MESDHGLHLLPNRVRGISPNESTVQSSVDIKGLISKLLPLLKRHAGTVRDRWYSLYNLATSLYSTWITDWWMLEILSWLSAAWALAMITLTLALYHGKPLPHWPSGITMNFLLSVLSQIGQWGLMGSVAKTLGQLKWLWFARPKRPLMDFVAFDEASRGAWGSLLLLIKRRLMFVLTRSRK